MRKAPQRKHLRRLDRSCGPAGSPIYLVTTCTHGRRRVLLEEPLVHEIVPALAQCALRRAWAIGRYVVMPDHVHFFCSPTDDMTPLSRWVQYWKSLASRRWPITDDQPIWQTDFWDAQLRNDESYEAKWDYVRSNPVRHGLSTSPEAWPYQGELHTLSLD